MSEPLTGWDAMWTGPPRPEPRALILTPMALAGPAAAVCAVARIAAVVVPVEVGAVAVLADPEEHSAHDAARSLSTAMSGAAVVLLRRGPSEDPAAADIQVCHYQNGTRTSVAAPGLVLARLPGELEDLLLGVLDPHAVAGAVDATALSQAAAMRILATAARAAKGGPPPAPEEPDGGGAT
ncbi:MAG: hypothetical protein LBK72_02345 [Bifidobacteriaceae bacterium]|nr:hypothetical protein [Bifidobacteriaceae bacterium]